MFELTSKNPDQITITTKTTTINFDIATATIDADLAVGQIQGPGEFEIGDVTIVAVDLGQGRTAYNAEIGGAHVAIIGNYEENLDNLGIVDILCTSSVKAIREIEPKMVVAMGNVDGMVADLKVTARSEKKFKVKKLDDLPATLEVVALS